MKVPAALAAVIALIAGLAACSSTSSGTAAPTAKASAAPTSGIEVIYGKRTGRVVVSGSGISGFDLTFTGPVAAKGTVGFSTAPLKKGDLLVFESYLGDLVVTYSSVIAPSGGLTSAKTCRVVIKRTVPFTVDGAQSTGKFAGATGTGKAVAVVSGHLPKLSSGKCNERYNVKLSAKTAVARFTATVKLTIKK